MCLRTGGSAVWSVLRTNWAFLCELWMLWTPNEISTGYLHPRYNLWYAFSLVDAYDATHNASYLDAAVRTTRFYATSVQQPDGTIWYKT